MSSEIVSGCESPEFSTSVVKKWEKYFTIKFYKTGMILYSLLFMKKVKLKISRGT